MRPVLAGTASGGPLVDPQGRRISYLRLSVTDLCNLRCFYCMPRGVVDTLPHPQVLRLDEMAEVVRVGLGLGLAKVRITGGEPLVRPDLVCLVQKLAALDGLRELAMTTNGTRLGEHAAALREAGLGRVNVSLDTTDPALYRRITGRDLLGRVLTGVEAALAVGLPVKLNAVLLHPEHDQDVDALVRYAAERALEVRFIEQMTFDGSPPHVVQDDALDALARRHELVPLPPDPEHPHVRRYRCDGVDLGFISPVSHTFCGTCNKLRLTSHGQLRPCLATDLAVDLRAVLRRPHDARNLEDAIRAATHLKPAAGPWTASNPMRRVGG